MRTASCLALIAIWRNFHFRRHGAPQLPEPADRRRGDHGNGRRGPALRRGPRGPVVGQVDETRLPPCVMLNPGASAHESNGDQPGDLTMRAAAGETIPDLPADDRTTRPDSAVVDDSPAAASEVVEEYVEE